MSIVKTNNDMICSLTILLQVKIEKFLLINIIKTSGSQSTIPFTKQALQAIFNRYAPSFHVKSILLRMLTQTNEVVVILRITIYLISSILNTNFCLYFNNHYNQYANMLIRIYPSRKSQYIWSNKQHILITNVLINRNKVEFIK